MRHHAALQLRLLSALAITLLGSGITYNIFHPFLSWITIHSSHAIAALFHAATLQGNMLTVNGQAIEFIPACIATAAYLLLAILILLTKDISLNKGISMFLIGSALILAANLIRIEALIAILLAKGANYFESLHLFTWKFLASLYVAGAWILLCKKQ